MVHMLRDLKGEEDSPVVSYFTQGGKILVRTSEDRDAKLIEVPIGVSKDQLREMCKGKKIQLTSLQIRNQFRIIHENNHQNDVRRVKRSEGQRQKDGSANSDGHARNQ